MNKHNHQKNAIKNTTVITILPHPELKYDQQNLFKIHQHNQQKSKLVFAFLTTTLLYRIDRLLCWTPMILVLMFTIFADTFLDLMFGQPDQQIK